MNVRGKGDKDDEVQVGVKVPLEGMGNVQDGDQSNCNIIKTDYKMKDMEVT